MVQGRGARRCGRTAETCVLEWGEKPLAFDPRQTYACGRWCRQPEPWSAARQADEGQGHGLEVDLNAWPWRSDPDEVLSPEA